MKSFKEKENSARKIPVLVWGASDQAEIVTDILSLSDEYTIEAYVDDVKDLENAVFNDKPILQSRDAVTKIYANGIEHAIIAIGDIQARKKLVPVLLNIGFTFIKAIHKTAIISDKAEIGANTIIKAGAIVDPCVTIGDHCYIGAGVTIAHHAEIGKFVNITNGTNISGYSKIEDEVFLGTGCTIKDRTVIGKKSIVGAGSVVVSNIPANSVAKGVPAKSKKGYEKN